MDWAKLPLEKLFVFIAALIPGSSVLLVVALHRSDRWTQFWNTTYLGYQSKIVVLAFVAFAAGITITEIVAFVVNFVISFIASFTAAVRKGNEQRRSQAPAGQIAPPEQPPPVEPQVAPWRSTNWRKLLALYLGDAAPENVAPAQDPQLANDGLWQEWWNLLYRLATPKKDAQATMVENVEVNFGSACLVLLLAIPWTPVLRQWWIILLCSFWVFIIAAFWSQQYKNTQDVGYAYSKQMEYLQMRVCKGEREGDDAQ